MFYHQYVYIKKGNLANVWLASHMIRKLNAHEIRHTDIPLSVGQVKDQKTPLALRLCGQLLLGLARIYDMKVRQAAEEADRVQTKLGATAVRSVRRARAADEESLPGRGEGLQADPRKLRAAHAAITAHADAVRGHDFSTLGGAYADDLDLNIESILDDPLGAAGMELQEALHGMEEPHLQFNLETGAVSGKLLGNEQFSLTQASFGTPLGSFPTPVEEGREDELMMQLGGDEEFVLEPEAGAGDDFGLDLVEGGRDANITQHTGLGDDELSIRGKELDLGSEMGGQGGMEDGDEIPPPDAASVDVDAGIEQARAELEAIKRAKKDAARAKRARNATYAPLIDEVTELSNPVIRSWLEDTSDIRVERYRHTADTSYAQQQIENMRKKLHASLRLPGLRYSGAAARDTDAIDDAVSEAPATPRSVAMAGDLSHIGADEFDFGGGGGFGSDDAPFVGETQLPLEGDEEREDRMSVAASEFGGVGTEAEADASREIDDLLGALSGDGSADSLLRARLVAEDVRRFFDESKSGSAERHEREHHESGWSRRTKKYYTVLAAQFRALPRGQKEVSLEQMLQTHARIPTQPRSRATAAAALYQTLVLASSGFVQPRQADGLSFSDVTIAKTATFDSKKLPAVPSGSEESRLTQSSLEY